MAYAAVDDVLARAGRFAGLFSVTGKRPDNDDLEALLADVAAIIDSKIVARGYDPASLTATTESALRDVNAYAVLLRALPAATTNDPAIDDLMELARAVVTAAGFEELAAGGAIDIFGAIAAIEAGAGGGGTGAGAGSYWDDVEEPADERDADEIGEAAAPLWQRGQSL